MNIFDLFKKKKVANDIIKIGNDIVLPKIEDLNEEQIKLLDKYKSEYLSKLNQFKIITSKHLSSDKLKDDMNLNLDLILKLLMNNEDFYNYKDYELIILALKLSIYYKDLIALEEDVTLRLIALNEINTNHRVYRHNKNTLYEEVNNLSVILEMFSYRKMGLLVEYKNYLNMLKIDRNIDINNFTRDEYLIKYELNNLLKLTKGIINIDLDNNNILNIVLLEKACEEYAYKNKDKVKELVDKILNSQEENDCDINYRELGIFKKYGCGIVTDDDIKKVCKLKIYKNFFEKDFSEIELITKEDIFYDYYKEVIMEMIYIINQYQGKLEYGLNMVSKQMIKIFNTYMKTIIYADFFKEENEYNFDEILGSKYKMYLLIQIYYRGNFHTTDNMINDIPFIRMVNDIPFVSFDEEHVILYDFFTKIKFNEVDYFTGPFEDLCLSEPGIKWHKGVNLATIFEYVSKKNPLRKHPLYNLFNYYCSTTQYLEEEFLSLDMFMKEIDFTKMNKDLYEKFVYTYKPIVSKTESGIISNLQMFYTHNLEKLIYGNFLEDTKANLKIENNLYELKPVSQRNYTSIYQRSLYSPKNLVIDEIYIENLEDSNILTREGIMSLVEIYLYNIKIDKENKMQYYRWRLIFNRLIISNYNIAIHPDDIKGNEGITGDYHVSKKYYENPEDIPKDVYKKIMNAIKKKIDNDPMKNYKARVKKDR